MRQQVQIMGAQANDRMFIPPKDRLMSQAPKDTRSAAEKARDTAGIIGSLKHEGYVPNAEDDAIHQQALRDEITSEEAIAIFRECGLQRERKAPDAQASATRGAVKEGNLTYDSGNAPATSLKRCVLPGKYRGGDVIKIKYLVAPGVRSSLRWSAEQTITAIHGA
jgi:hypothetical protein